MRPLLILLIIIILVVGISADDEDYSNPVELESLHMDYESKTIILRESKKLVVTCTYAKDDIADTSDLQWKHEGGKNIDESSSPSVFTVGLRTHKTGYRKRNLHFSGVHKRDAGTYVCYGKNLDGTTFQNSVKIDVLDDIAWTDPATEAGALVGEPLTIDCSVKSRSSGEPQIQITNGDGEALDPEDYTIAGNEVTIKEMTRDFDGQKISCVHVELVTRGKDSDFPLVDRKDVEIVAWYKPEFDEDVKELYTIVSEKNSQPGHATLYCNVTASSPAATHFVFYRGSEALTDSAKYELTKHIGQVQGAELKIKDLNQDDLDEYKCEVNNGKVKATQIIHLKEANPPPEPKVSMEKHKKHSIVWKVESSENEGELPIIEVQIEYIRKSILHERDIDSDEDDEISNGIWERYGKLVNRPKAKNNLYEITGLRQGSDYRFRFRLISQAGAGELMSLSARTADAIPLEDENSLPCSLLISSLSVLMLSSLW